MRRSWLAVPLMAGLLTTTADAQPERLVQGRVVDVETSAPLAAANVRLLGTNRGTIANAEGSYLLRVPRGPQTLVFSFVGFASDTFHVPPAGNQVYMALLEPIVLEGSTITVSGDDPARAIIRRAIDAKLKQREGLESYRFEAYTRRVISREDSIAGILDGYSVGYWRRGEGRPREQVVQRRQTENLPDLPEMQGVLDIQDFSLDDLQLTGDTFVGPLHPDAFRWYDYTLVSERRLGDLPIYEIRLEPRSVLVPLLRGTVQIADGSWALVGVDLEPAEMTAIPFVRDFRIRWQQSFALKGGRYWLPGDIRMEGGLKVAIGPISIPRIGFRQTAILYDYLINVSVPDSLFERDAIAVEMPGAAEIDPEFWAEHEVLPLTGEEERAYADLDSTKTLEEQFAPEGLGMRMTGDSLSLSAGRGAGRLGALLSHLSLAYNRVDGRVIGVHVDTDSLFGDPQSRLRLRVRRSESAERWQWEAAFGEEHRSSRRAGSVGRHAWEISWFDRTAVAPDAGFYPEFMNSLGSLISKTDYRDYHRTHGFRITNTLDVPPDWSLSTRIGVERHSSLTVRTQYSLLYRDEPFRDNPPVTDGLWTLMQIGLSSGQPESVAGLSTGSGWRLRLDSMRPSDDLSRGAVTQSVFYALSGVASLSTSTWTSRFIFSPYLAVRLAGSIATAGLPIQFHRAPEGPYGGYAPLSTMRGLDPREMAADRWWSLNLEHNFRNIPYRALGLDFLADRGIEMLVHGGIARAWRFGVPIPDDRPYMEAGFGIGRIYDLFRVDLTRRLVAPVGWHVSLALTTFL